MGQTNADTNPPSEEHSFVGRKNAGSRVATNDTAAEEQRVCMRLRALMRDRGVTLDALAPLSGFSKEYLAKIVDCMEAPPFATLARLGHCLGEDLSYFFVDAPDDAQAEVDDSPISVVHSWERRPVSKGGTAYGFEFVTLEHKLAHKKMEPFLFTFVEGVEHEEYFQHPGEEFLYVMSGSIEFEVKLDGHAKIWQLEAGDCLYFNSVTPHRVTSISNISQVMIIVTR
ncbi:cupin domain-containing protein [Paraburkholderia sp. BCC1884]|uniref:cupin domain-containing protein n=1 Tax=Paraburkholderia sp. BCC1884 TaxID=2562668 RepID=UPI0021B33F52|nr:cupin domain-containing protein [Paraburkholderia sp. BCC1884]